MNGDGMANRLKSPVFNHFAKMCGTTMHIDGLASNLSRTICIAGVATVAANAIEFANSNFIQV